MNANKKDEKTGLGKGCLTIFGAVFLIAGMLPGVMSLKMLWHWQQAQTWQAVNATIDSTDPWR